MRNSRQRNCPQGTTARPGRLLAYESTYTGLPISEAVNKSGCDSQVKSCFAADNELTTGKHTGLSDKHGYSQHVA